MVASVLLGLLTYVILRRVDGSRRVTFTVGNGRLEVRGDLFAESFFLAELDLQNA